MIGQPFTILDETDSSNNYAIAQALNGSAAHGAAFFARHQTAGKGQRGRIWNDEAQKNIALSVLLNMAVMQVQQPFTLIAAAGLAAYDLISKYALDETKIKWANDIYWRDRKAVGILIENRFAGQKWQWAVAGMGVNVNQTQFDEALQKKAVSLKQITGKDFDCIALAKELCGFLEQRLVQLEKEGAASILQPYNNNLYKRDQSVRVRYVQHIYEVVIRQADENGNLWIDNGPKPFFSFGEIEWILE